MIVDHFDNIDIYRCMPDIYTGLQFLAKADPDIDLGEVEVNHRVRVLVAEYRTCQSFERGYEGHKHVIDIQYPIIGLERVKWSPIKGMDVNIPYDTNKDRTFYSNPSDQGTHVDIGDGIFAIMFPNDGHSPQHFIDEPRLIKKITVKIKI